jgi:hypothetical protein
MSGRIAWRAFGSGCSTISVGSCRPSRGGGFRRRGGQDRSGRRRAASMASRMSGRGCIRIDGSGRLLCSGRVSGRLVRTALRLSRSTSFIVCVPSSVTELAGRTCSSVLAKPHKNHPVARYIARYAAVRKLSASTKPEGSESRCLTNFATTFRRDSTRCSPRRRNSATRWQR